MALLWLNYLQMAWKWIRKRSFWQLQITRCPNDNIFYQLIIEEGSAYFTNMKILKNTNGSFVTPKKVLYPVDATEWHRLLGTN